MTRIIIAHVYLGAKPPWFELFLASCRHSPEIDFLVFSDQSLTHNLPANVREIYFQKDMLTQLIELKLNRKVLVADAYKICDFKSMFGKLFADYFAGYDYWGYCDNDILFGNIADSLPRPFALKADVISFYGQYLSGPFCIFKNSPEVCTLFYQSEIIDLILNSPEYCGFDEHIVQPAIRLSWLTRSISILHYLFTYSFINFKSFKEWKYQYQWFYKKQWNRCRKLLDMTDIVHRMTLSGQIKSYFSELIASDRKYKRLGKNSWKLKFESGKITEASTSKPVQIFHFIDLKNNPVNWQIPYGTETFYISSDGVEFE